MTAMLPSKFVSDIRTPGGLFCLALFFLAAT